MVGFICNLKRLYEIEISVKMYFGMKIMILQLGMIKSRLLMKIHIVKSRLRRRGGIYMAYYGSHKWLNYNQSSKERVKIIEMGAWESSRDTTGNCVFTKFHHPNNDESEHLHPIGIERRRMKEEGNVHEFHINGEKVMQRKVKRGLKAKKQKRKENALSSAQNLPLHKLKIKIAFTSLFRTPYMRLY
ncbi:hypothetical protein H5410_043666 [Solanum commersonii]|uniref:Uncharacterized protein n=1 Tax=Solanum commersonii TaxID=4109 RepID=A0A9J5Y0V6_SOLCO|nr:hypothetical protein H5410_043666 [Solanum commersonii]